MTTPWDHILQTALLGTARKQLPALQPFPDDLASLLTARLDAGDADKQLLSAMAIGSTNLRAGFAGLSLQPTLEPAPVDSVQPFNTCSMTILKRLLAEFAGLLPEFYEVCRRHDRRIPDSLLVDVLSHAEASPDVRTFLLPVLGARGVWLARLRAEWMFAATGTGRSAEDTVRSVEQDAWQTGSKEQRVILLGELRRQDPGRARQLAEATWKQEDADFRVLVVNALEERLSQEDEPFLESVLDDRRKEVRAAAQALLARLPASAFARRHLDLAAGYLKVQIKSKGLLARLTGGEESAAIDVDLPSECTDAMQRDGIAAKVPAGQKLGERAWWLRQILMSISPTELAKRLGLSGDQLFRAAQSNKDWGKDLFEAWRVSIKRCHDADWAFRLCSADKNAYADLLPLLRQEARDAMLVESVRAATPATARALIGQVLEGHGRMSVPVAKALLVFLKDLTANDPTNQVHPQYFPWVQLAASFPAEVLDEALDGWPTRAASWEHWRGHVDKLLQPLQLRLDFHRELAL